MVPVSAVREPAQPVVPPGPREKDAAGGDARLRREAAVSEVETIRLGERMGRRRDEADIARVPERPQFTPVEQGFAAAVAILCKSTIFSLLKSKNASKKLKKDDRSHYTGFY